MKRLLAISFLVSSCAALTSEGPAPDEKTRFNYGGRCGTEDVIYVQRNRWWWHENKGRGIPGEWHFGGKVERINDDQITIKEKVYTRIESKRYQC